jgi:DNA adenine methylase
VNDGCVNFVDPCWGSGAVWLACPGWGDPMTIPVPWFGGKSRAARIIWDRFGHDLPRVATGNDINGFVANFFRAVAGDPEAVARAADAPVHECDLHAWHRHLLAGAAEMRAMLDADPEAFDAKKAGRWAWGASAWIGSGWCEEGGESAVQLPVLNGGGGSGASTQRGVLNASMREPSRRLPDLAGGTQWGTDEPNTRPGKGVHGATLREPSLQLPDLGGGSGDSPGVGRGLHNLASRTRLYDIFAELSRRLRYVRFSCGDAFRILTPTVTYRHGRTAILLDAPYADHEYVYGAQVTNVRPPSANKLARMEPELQAMWEELTPLYADGKAPGLSRRFQAYARTHGGRPDLRIAICGYEGEHDVLEREGWECVAWKSKGGYANQGDGENVNQHRERIWFSPHCVRPGVAVAVPRQLTIAGLA